MYYLHWKYNFSIRENFRKEQDNGYKKNCRYIDCNFLLIFFRNIFAVINFKQSKKLTVLKYDIKLYLHVLKAFYCSLDPLCSIA